MKDLLLVIDMQNVYLPEQPWACETAARTKENILKLLEHRILRRYHIIPFPSLCCKKAFFFPFFI